MPEEKSDDDANCSEKRYPAGAPLLCQPARLMADHESPRPSTLVHMERSGRPPVRMRVEPTVMSLGLHERTLAGSETAFDQVRPCVDVYAL